MTAEAEHPQFKIAALVFIEQAGKILLVKQRKAPGYWSLPGGLMEAGEDPVQAAVREVLEETGLQVAVTRLVGVYTLPGENAVAFTFVGQQTGGSLVTSTDETCDCRYFDPQALPDPVRAHLAQRAADFVSGQPHAFIRRQPA
ncbi:MAG: NUDIX domain-containing protein [Anaerolineae bacterium]|nr:NUDIX domain-containing protein [Anaerolineae bacterium]